MSLRAFVAAGVIAAVMQPVVPPVAAAQAPTPELAASDRSRERREAPDYGSLRDPHPSPEEVLLWIPRVILFPIHFVFEYVLRQPLLLLATTAEREGWVDIIRSLLQWDEGRGRLLPTAFYDLGFRPNIGLHLSWDDRFGAGSGFAVRFAFGGTDFLEGELGGHVRVRDRVRVEASVGGSRRPDGIFAGIGYDSLEPNRARFARDWAHGALGLRIEPWRSSYLRASVGVDFNRFANSTFNSRDDFPMLQAVDLGIFDLPPGFAEGYTAYRQRVELHVDSRATSPTAPQHGAMITAFGEQAFDLQRGPASSWVSYGVGGALFADLGGRRVLGWWALFSFADPLGREPLPFTELVELGGEVLPFGGYREGRLRGQSASASTISYRYPVLHWLDGEIFVSIGNVFGPHFRDFEPERLRISFGGGIRTVGTPDGFAFLVAAGSETFEQGGSLTSVRLAVGSGLDL